MDRKIFVVSVMTAVMFVAAVVTSCNKEEAGNNSLKEEIVTTLRAHGELSEFADALNGMDFSNINSDKLTVFAATNGVFSSPSFKSSEENECEATINRHIVEGKFAFSDLTDSLKITALDGTILLVTIIEERVYINGVELLDILPCGDNVIYVVSKFIPCNAPENKQIPADGIYSGFFTVTYLTNDSISGRTTLELSDGKFTCTGNPNKIPAGGSGSYSIKDGNIIFEDENGWYADFDWNLILNGEYRYWFDGKRLRILADRNNAGRYEYELEKE